MNRSIDVTFKPNSYYSFDYDISVPMHYKHTIKDKQLGTKNVFINDFDDRLYIKTVYDGKTSKIIETNFYDTEDESKTDIDKMRLVCKKTYTEDGYSEKQFYIYEGIGFNYAIYYGTVHGYRRMISEIYYTDFTHTTVFKQIFYNYNKDGTLSYMNELYGDGKVTHTHYMYNSLDDFTVKKSILNYGHADKNVYGPNKPDRENIEYPEYRVSTYTDLGNTYQIHKDSNGKIYGIYRVTDINNGLDITGMKRIKTSKYSCYFEKDICPTNSATITEYIPYHTDPTIYINTKDIKAQRNANYYTEYTFNKDKYTLAINDSHSSPILSVLTKTGDTQYYQMPNNKLTENNRKLVERLESGIDGMLSSMLHVIEQFDPESYELLRRKN